MQKNTVENNFVQTPKLVCVKTPRGRYTLNTVNANGDMRRVKQTLRIALISSLLFALAL